MTDAGVPPVSPEGAPSASTGPPPRVGAGDVTATPSAHEAATTDGEAAERSLDDLGPAAAPGSEEFWSDDDATSRPRRRGGLQSRLRTMLEWVAVAVGALAVALLIKAFLLQAFYIPSGSMEPTLHEDDRVLVNKLSYRFGDPQRGDVIVFAKPDNAPGNIDDFIKRVIALPGETISFSDGTVFVDGRALEEPYIAGAPSNSGRPIPNCAGETPLDDTCTIPADMVFVMGDNRVGSQDSRIFGPIEIDSIVGRAFLKVWPLGDLGFL